MANYAEITVVNSTDFDAQLAESILAKCADHLYSDDERICIYNESRAMGLID